MEKKITTYILDLSNNNFTKVTLPITKEKSWNYYNTEEKCFDRKEIYYAEKDGEEYEFKNSSMNCVSYDSVSHTAYVQCVDDGYNTFENEKIVVGLFTEYIENRQKENEKRYYEETSRNNNFLHTIKDAFTKPNNFIDEIKKQAVNCTEMLSKCDCVDYIKFLSNKGYKDKIMVDINNNGLIALHSVLDSLTDDCQVCRIQLESYENLGVVLYDFEEEKLYFSVFKGDDEYAIIEDTTLETLREDYQAYLDKENERDI